MRLNLHLRKDQPREGNLFPVTLRLNIGSSRRFYPIKHNGTNLLLSPADYENIIQTKNPRKENRAIKETLEATKRYAEEILDDRGRYKARTFHAFEAHFLKQTKTTLIGHFDAYLKNLLDEERAGTWRSYQTTRNIWEKNFKPFDVFETTEHLDHFAGLIKHPTSRAIHLRQTRAVYNKVREKLRSLPPWEFKIKNGLEQAKGLALTPEQFDKFKASACITPQEEEAKRLFLASLFAGGMNFADLLTIKQADIKDGHIHFVRKKTKRTGKLTTTPITPALELVLYPLYQLTGTPLQLKDKISDIIFHTNTGLKAICNRVGLPEIGTYAARHTFASLLSRSDVSVETISMILGHRDIKTTKAYLSTLTYSDKKREAFMVLNKVA